MEMSGTESQPVSNSRALLQGVLGAVAVSAVFLVLHLMMPSAADPRLVYAFIAAMALVSGVLSFRRAMGGTAGVQSRQPVIASVPLAAAAAFLVLLLYGVAVSALFIRQPGDPQLRNLSMGLFFGAMGAVEAYRRRKKMTMPFWKYLALAVLLAVAAALVTRGLIALT